MKTTYTLFLCFLFAYTGVFSQDTTQYSVKIVASALKGCTGNFIDLSSNIFKANSNDVTYNWSVKGSGSLTGNHSDLNTLIIDSGEENVTVLLTVNNDTTDVSDSVVIANAGITIAITNSLPIFRDCNNTPDTITTNTAGSPLSQQGKVYHWNDNSSDSTLRLIAAGKYNVTATNGSGCTATTSAEVKYNNGVVNEVGFTLSKIMYPFSNCTFLFTNTSTFVELPWLATLDGDGTGQNTVTVADGDRTIAYNYSDSGIYTATLTMDSAGCTFSRSETIQVQTSPFCKAVITAIPVIQTATNITVRAYPNPFSNLTNIVVEGLNEKFNFEMYDVTGRLGKRITGIESDHFQVNRETLPSGIYFYRIVTSGGKNTYGKLVVE